MSVNFFFLFGYFLVVLFEHTLQQAATSSNAGKAKPPPKRPVCNSRLLSSLRLQGHEIGDKIFRSTICPIKAKDNCCSRLDEIKIIKSWNSFTLPKLEKFADDMAEIYKNFIDIEPYLLRLNASNIEYHFDNIAWRKTNESQCFSGKFFLEQSNYDLVKNGFNITRTIINEFARQVAFNISRGASNRVITRKNAFDLINQVFNNGTDLEERLRDSVGSSAIDLWSADFSNAFADVILQARPPQVNLPPIPPNQDRSAFVNRLLNITEIALFHAKNISDTFFINVLQSRAADIHVVTLMNYLNSTLNTTLRNNWRLRVRQINITELLNDISDEMFFDPVLKRYLAWFLVPTSRQRYVRVYKYLENRFYKIFSDAISRSASLSQHAHYAVLKEVMALVTDSSLRSILVGSYQQIAASIIMNIVLDEYVTKVYLGSTIGTSKAQFYREMIREIYRNRYSVSLSNFLQIGSRMWWRTDGQANSAITQLKNNLKECSNRIQSRSFNTYIFNLTNDNVNITAAANQFITLNLRAARFAEFTGDNKRVCATVYRHNLVREAIFNEQKFSYCLLVDEGYRNQSAAAKLGPIDHLKKHITKIVELKAGFYCAACSSRGSRKINFGVNSIQLSNNFCFQFISTFRPYLQWRYNLFQIYQNTIFQYLSCYGRNANLTDQIPYESFDGLLPNNFTEWLPCESVYTIENISLCAPVCKRITLTNWGAWIEGDRKVLKRLYNYAITVMRQYGIQYGTFDPYRNSNTTAPTQRPGRLLQERKRTVVYNLEPDPKRYNRALQAPAASATPAANKTNSTSVVPMELRRLLRDPTVAMLYQLLTTVDKMKEYSRIAHYNHDEITACKNNYEISETIPDMRNMTSTISKNGINPFNTVKAYKFQMAMLETFYTGQGGKPMEMLQKEVIKNCIRVHRLDVMMFNNDFSLTLDSTFRDPATYISFAQSNESLFGRYDMRQSQKWKSPPKKMVEVYKLRKKGDRKLRHDQTEKQTKITGKVGSFVKNLLFKVWF